MSTTPSSSLFSVGDRRVHARLVTGAEIVRYERAGKWYLEPTEGKRSLLTIGDAVALACTPLCEVFYDLPGGEAFDRKVRAAVTQATAQPTYWDMVEAALTFARGQAYSESTSRMVERALGAFDHLKARVTS